jgi:hypothetical protein
VQESEEEIKERRSRRKQTLIIKRTIAVVGTTSVAAEVGIAKLDLETALLRAKVVPSASVREVVLGVVDLGE